MGAVTMQRSIRGLGPGFGLALRAMLGLLGCCVLSDGVAEAERPRVGAADDRDGGVDFCKELIPALTQAGCNAGACHGAAAGRGYLALSLYGSRPQQDYHTLLHAPGTRFVDLENPTDSLLLRKPSGYLDHGGGVVLDEDGQAYRLLRQWIEGGCALAPPADIERLLVAPGTSLAAGCGEPMKVDVRAVWSDGASTSALPYLRIEGAQPDDGGKDQSPVVFALDADGLVFWALTPGYWPVTIRFGKSAVTLQLWAAPSSGASDVGSPSVAGSGASPVGGSSAPETIDALVAQATDRIGMERADHAPPHLVARRLYLDLLGRHPRLEEWRRATAQIQDGALHALVDDLLDRPEFPRHAARVIVGWVEDAAGRPSPVVQDLRNAVAARLARNDNLRDLIRAMLQVQEPEASGLNQVHRLAASPGERSELVSKAFLGVRIGCAQCHDHPLDHWTQDDYFGLAACWAEIESTGSLRRIPGRTTTDPRTGRDAIAGLPHGGAISGPPDVGVVEWICSPDNPLFVGNLANRMWAWLVGTPLVDPVDDQRSTNPAVNPALHRWLSEYVVTQDFSVKQVAKAIALTNTYARTASEDAPPLARRLAAVRGVQPIDIPLAQLAGQALTDGAPASGDVETRRSGTAMMMAAESPDTEGCTRDAACENPIRRNLMLGAGGELAPIIARSVQAAQPLSGDLPPQESATAWLSDAYHRLFGVAPAPPLMQRIAADLSLLPPQEVMPYMEDVVWSWIVNRRFTQMY